MRKYQPLFVFLRRWKNKHAEPALELSFAEIERIINALLPNSAAVADWWRNEPSGERTGPQSRAWIEAGFDAHPMVTSERVRFRRRHRGEKGRDENLRQVT